ncbi:MAG: virulence protein RhuM/Fic/DOC family protein [Chitinophagaceae bacterium]|nr:virulence protein RhuM/Fic/DOC family protein [Chitinophagaceae bacterium]
MNEIIIYKSKDKKTQVDVKFENDTVWLTQQQMAELFGQTKQNISLHINNCFKEKELSKKATVKESLTVQKEGSRSVRRKLEYFNLDVIISVGYRVKSIRGTQFRQWATQRLKDFLTIGIAINEKQLEQQNKEIKILHDGIRILSRAIEEKAAMLLYLIVKNHAFVDGNKRIAAACFLLFLEQNGLLFNAQRQSIISNEALASLTLLVASSKAEEMETVKRLLISVLNRNLS